ncbi:MAG: hypothetical protein KDA27_13785 [Candidatus Eisenbacteria bacterium]|uniref:Uncharacterized protein n=1 Tax=Eiseniibacteriota bacterium TaxID=2212470 RepID=A0A956NG95_UNCEI|nr:hypothetical protein [Candidatus Eisenbacteria bacterium]MCB9466413.1 hypothetical protein [Candidatus Eisenbacteria bacterium]
MLFHPGRIQLFPTCVDVIPRTARALRATLAVRVLPLALLLPLCTSPSLAEEPDITPEVGSSSGTSSSPVSEQPDTTRETGDEPSVVEPASPAPIQDQWKGTGLYAHFGGGAGLAFLSSDDITELFGDEFTIGLGFHLSWSVALGFRNLVQAEIRRGDSAHTLRNNNIVTNTSVEIPMDYDYTEYVAKLNLLGLSRGNIRKGETALFLLGGACEVEYLDEAKDGFKGSGSVIGMEFVRFAPNGVAAVSLGARRYGIEFDRITLFGQTVAFPANASNWVMHTAVTVGLGF